MAWTGRVRSVIDIERVKKDKKFYGWKVIVNNIRNQCGDKEDQDRYVGAIFLKDGMKRGRAISSFAILIREDKVRVKKKR